MSSMENSSLQPSSRQVKSKGQHRSRVTNGSELLPGVDGRSTWHRRCRDLIELFSTDLGGAESLSSAKQQIVRRCAVTIIELESSELKFATGPGAEPAELDLYQRTSNTLRRNLESLGLERVPKDVTGVNGYLARIDGRVNEDWYTELGAWPLDADRLLEHYGEHIVRRPLACFGCPPLALVAA